jgi:prepilin-type N-terminal cleavage/methylation domain-containing protein
MSPRQQGGFSLVELLVSLTIFSAIMVTVVWVMLTMQRGYVRQREIAQTEDALRVAEITTTAIFRAGAANPRNIATGNAGFPRIDPYEPPFDTVRVLSDFNPDNGNTTDLLEDMLVYVTNDTLYTRWQNGQPALPVAFPVRTLAIQYDSNGTVLNTRADVTRAANRARVTLEAPRHSRTTVLARRVTWVYLRNRR